ncbi:MAG: methyltransferase domain-containing protein [Gammaproteobacteria bacterium]
MGDSSTSVQMSDGHSFWEGAGGDLWARTMEVSERNFVSMSAVLMAAADPQPGEQVLDMGCGGGVTSRDLARRVAPDGAVLGADISDTLVSFARQRHGDLDNLNFRRMEIGVTPLVEGAFDLIYSRFGVMFFNHPTDAFSQLHAALKAQGRLVFMAWRQIKENPWMYATTRAGVAELPEALRPAAPEDPFAPGPFALADADRTRELLTGAGFGSVSIEPLDDVMRMANEKTALEYLLALGPLGQILKQVNDERAMAVKAAMGEVLRGYATADELNIPSATWIVTARP